MHWADEADGRKPTGFLHFDRLAGTPDGSRRAATMFQNTS
jgi:hypothetical protein